jgi:hypothetical protein
LHDTVADYFEFWVRADPMDIEYVLDTAALTEVPAPVDFEAETDAKIDLIRKTDISVRYVESKYSYHWGTTESCFRKETNNCCWYVIHCDT